MPRAPVRHLSCTLAELEDRARDGQCVACDGRGAGTHPVYFASGASARVPPTLRREVPLCHPCGAAQRRAGRARLLVPAIAGLTPIVATLSVLGGFPPGRPIGALVAVGAATLLGLILTLFATTRIGRRTPVLVLGAAGDRIELQLAPPPRRGEDGVGPYRSPEAPEGEGGAPTRARAVSGGALVVPVVLAVAALGYDALVARAYPIVQVDNPSSRDFVVELDNGQTLTVSRLGRVAVRMPYGKRTVRIRTTMPEAETERLAITLPFDSTALLVLPGSDCYRMDDLDGQEQTVHGRFVTRDREQTEALSHARRTPCPADTPRSLAEL